MINKKIEYWRKYTARKRVLAARMQFGFSLLKIDQLCCLIACLLMMSCGNGDKANAKSKIRFHRLSSEESGIDFINKIVESDSLNLIVNEYAYMGGGVGIIDVNNDGLQDVFFTGSQQSCRLYLNEGKNHFKDITTSAGVATTEWCTGVNVVDINNDGFDDLYVSVGGNTIAEHRKNLLFVNNK